MPDYGKSVYMPHRTLKPVLLRYLHHWIVFSGIRGDPTIHRAGGAAALRVLISSWLIPPSVPYHPTTLSLTTEEAVSLSLLIFILHLFC